MIPEYLELFGNDGSITVKVKFRDVDGFISDRRLNARCINALVSEETGELLSSMTFDEHEFEVEKYEINPIKKTLTIFASDLSA